MRKFKTRMLKNHRPRKGAIRHLEERVFSSRIAHEDHAEEEAPEEPEALEPVITHKENYRIRPLYEDEAIMDLELEPAGRSSSSTTRRPISSPSSIVAKMVTTE